MKLILFSAFFTLVSAHALHHGRHNGVHHRRQGPAPGSAGTVILGSSVSSSSSTSLPGPPPGPSVTLGSPSVPPVPGTTSTSVVAVPTGTSVLPTISATVVAPTVPPAPPNTVIPPGPGTDIPPLASITSGAPPEATAPLSTTYLAGAIPTYIPGAPALPAFTLTPSDWPTMDRTPPTDSDEVTQWMQELNGFDIPDIQPTINGSCALDPTAAANAESTGWWTCGGWTRPTDVVACPNKYTWGVSFDDGPAVYTPKLLRFLDENNILATFYTVGSRVLEYPLTLQDEYMAGHEIAVHTWSHPPLTSLTNEQIVAELGWTRKIIQTVLGVTPTFMRPPYGDIDDRVRAISLAMGLQPAIWTRGPTGEQFDTKDWEIPGGEVDGEESYAEFQYILGNATLIDTGFIVLEHDLFQETVDMAIGYTLPTAMNNTPKLTLEPIGKCNGWPAENMYLETTTNTTFPYLNSTVASVATTTASARAQAAAETGAAGSGTTSGSVRTASNVGGFMWTLLVGIAMVGVTVLEM